MILRRVIEHVKTQNWTAAPEMSRRVEERMRNTYMCILLA